MSKPPRDPARIDRVLAAIRTAWQVDSDMRLGQLLLNIARNDEGDTDKHKLWNMEEDELCSKLLQWGRSK